MIVVTGATGGLGSATVENLLERVPADRIGVSVRDVAQAQHFADRGVRVRQGSYEDPAALRNSFAGAEQVLLVSGNDPAADLVGLHRDAIEVAVATGGRTIERTVLDDEQWVADQITSGVLEQVARFMLTWYQASRAGHFAEADPLMAELLGREPRSAADRLAAHLAA